MQNRVSVTIADQKYTLLAAESQEYMDQVAALVDGQLRDTMRSGGRLSLMEATTLTALNLADSYLKEQESANNLRRQIKETLEESARLKLELSEAKREIFKLQNGKK